MCHFILPATHISPQQETHGNFKETLSFLDGKDVMKLSDGWERKTVILTNKLSFSQTSLNVNTIAVVVRCHYQYHRHRSLAVIANVL